MYAPVPLRSFERRLASPAPTLLAAAAGAAALVWAGGSAAWIYVPVGFAGGVIAGMVGVGGAVLMIPLLLYIPPLVGAQSLSMHAATGVSVVHVAAAGVAGTLGHLPYGPIHSKVVKFMGGGVVVGSFAGALISRGMTSTGLTGVFATLAVCSAVIMIALRHAHPGEGTEAAIMLHRRGLLGSGLGVGLVVGMVGAGGGVLLIPIMVHAFRIPMRIAVGASLATVALSGMAGAVGKAVIGQVHWLIALALVVGALPGARLGAAISRRTRTETLALILGLLLGVVAVKLWWDVIS